MIDYNTVELQQIRLISNFKKSFFQKFGTDLEVTIKPSVFIIPRTVDMDLTLSALKVVLDTYIPKEMRSESNTVFCNSRKRTFVELRMIFCKIARERGMSLTAIGKNVVHRHHTTVFYNIETANNMMLTDSNFRALYESIVTKLNHLLKEAHAGVNSSYVTQQGNTQSASIITLYPREYQANGTYPGLLSRNPVMSKR